MHLEHEDGTMLHIYIADHCYGCDRARRLADMVQTERPAIRMQIIDITRETIVPTHVIGTPMYLWHDRVLFMGNPSKAELLEVLDAITAT